MKSIAPPPDIRRPAEPLGQFAGALFTAAGLDADKAASVARLLLLTDMMGRRTHGLAQCPAYLEQLAAGTMTRIGQPETVRDIGSTIVWDGNYLPGLWLMDQALSLGFERLAQHGVVGFSMRRSHHIGCLAALAKQATDRGYFAMIASSGPHTKMVAPFGGKQGLFSPNPFAVGFPTTSEPVLVDICASVTTVSMTREKVAAGELFEHPWLMDSAGVPTRDPAVMERSSDRGSLLLLGGQEAGHKGFGLALMVEALTQGLSGFGRKDAPTRWGASVYLQLIDPGAFVGRDAFVEQMGFFAEQCHANAPIVAARARKEFDAVFAEQDMDAAAVIQATTKHASQAIFSGPRVRLTAADIASLPDSVRIIANPSAGTDHMDVAAARARGLAVTNTPDVLTDCTADLAFLLILAACRRAAEYDAIMRDGWRKPFGMPDLLGMRPSGRTLGIVGMGRIGQAVARRARGFDMRVLYHNRSRLAADLEYGAEYVESFEALLPRCDILSLHLPGGDAGTLMTREAIALLPRGAVFVNTARGTLVDEDALIEALQSGQLFAAGLDVYRREPDFDLRLAALPNVFLTPHVASATVETRDQMGFKALDNISAVLAGRAAINPV